LATAPFIGSTLSAAFTAALSLATISGGVPLGASSAVHAPLVTAGAAAGRPAAPKYLAGEQSAR